FGQAPSRTLPEPKAKSQSGSNTSARVATVPPESIVSFCRCRCPVRQRGTAAEAFPRSLWRDSAAAARQLVSSHTPATRKSSRRAEFQLRHRGVSTAVRVAPAWSEPRALQRRIPTSRLWRAKQLPWQLRRLGIVLRLAEGRGLVLDATERCVDVRVVRLEPV